MKWKLTTNTEVEVLDTKELLLIVNGLREQNVPERVLSDLVSDGKGVWDSGHVVTTYTLKGIKE